MKSVYKSKNTELVARVKTVKKIQFHPEVHTARYEVEVPNECPYCNAKIDGSYYKTLHENESISLGLVLCTYAECRKGFTVRLRRVTSLSYEIVELLPKPLPKLNMNGLDGLFPDFERIYKQAQDVDALGYSDIAGPGYRKAIEFLVKPYLVDLNSDEKEQIENESLAHSLKRIGDPRIQKVLTKAYWLANDETHYARKWEQYDISDLKTLINLVIYYIASEEMAKSYTDMDLGTKKT